MVVRIHWDAEQLNREGGYELPSLNKKGESMDLGVKRAIRRTGSGRDSPDAV